MDISRDYARSIQLLPNINWLKLLLRTYLNKSNVRINPPYFNSSYIQILYIMSTRARVPIQDNVEGVKYLKLVQEGDGAILKRCNRGRRRYFEALFQTLFEQILIASYLKYEGLNTKRMRKFMPIFLL